MNTPNDRWARGLCWVRTGLGLVLASVLTVVVVTPLLVPAAVYWSFRPSADLRALGRLVTQVPNAELDQDMALAVGPMVFGLARAVVALTDAPPEAQTALSAIRSAEVGIYRISSSQPALEPRKLFVHADEAMAKRGWERIVGVIGGREAVAVFVPRQLSSPRDFRLSVLVSDGAQVVIATVRGNPEALVDLALQQSGRLPSGRLAWGR